MHQSLILLKLKELTNELAFDVLSHLGFWCFGVFHSIKRRFPSLLVGLYILEGTFECLGLKFE